MKIKPVVLYIVDSGNNRVQVFGLRKEMSDGFLFSFGVDDQSQDLAFPTGIILKDRFVYVTDTANKKVTSYELSGKPRGDGLKLNLSIGTGGLALTSVVVDQVQNIIYAFDAGSKQIVVFQRDGTLKAVLGQGGTTEAFFGDKISMAVNDLSYLYVLDTQQDQVQIFDEKHQFVTSVGVAGGHPGEFKNASGIAIDKISNNIYIADTDNRRIQVFDREMKYLTEQVVSFSPQKMAYHAGSGLLYVVNSDDNRIEVMKGSDLSIVKNFGIKERIDDFEAILDIAVDADENVYLLGRRLILRVNSRGEFVSLWEIEEGPEWNGNEFEGISVDIDGNVFVAAGKDSLVKFDKQDIDDID